MKQTPATLGELKKIGYQSRTIHQELRANLIRSRQEGHDPFAGIIGYENTVIPQLERAILSGHSINLLGLRGQAKTRIARSMLNLLDEYIPVIEGSEIMDDPFAPLSYYGRKMVSDMGDATPIAWVHRSDRYAEKLATPDVTVADLIGDIDPIKAANEGLDYSDERVIHFGLIPRANRSIFVINEIPDLQARIQVALFNILQEGDIQIRGFKLRLPLDIQFVFTANPEDYTNRGSIVTPLKDRIQSQIITHYPQSIEQAAAITQQEASIPDDQRGRVTIFPLMHHLVEQIAFEARESELIDQKSGVSARLSISAMELLHSAVERRALFSPQGSATSRIMDLFAVVPAITGKVELVYEGEQEGAAGVAYQLIGKAIRAEFPTIFPDPESMRKARVDNPYQGITNWFATETRALEDGLDDAAYRTALSGVDGLQRLVKRYAPHADEAEQTLLMEFVLFGLAEFSVISATHDDEGISFSDILSAIFSAEDDPDLEGDEDTY